MSEKRFRSRIIPLDLDVCNPPGIHGIVRSASDAWQFLAGNAGKLVYNKPTKLQKIVVAVASGERIRVNALQKTLAIVALLVLVSQTVRHAYVLWLEPRNSVLDKYDRPLKDEISAATSLDQLLSRYDQAHAAAEAARKEAAKNGEPNPEYKLTQTEPFKSERALHEAITQWEARSKEIHALRFYWLVGVALSALGMLIYILRRRWLGLTFLIAGFTEIIYWTSPTFLGISTREFDRLLGYKLAFSVVSLALLLVAIMMQGIFTQGHAQPEERAAGTVAGA